MVRSGHVWEIGHTYETEAGSTAQGRTAEVAAQSHEARDQRLGAREKVEGLCNSAGQHLKMYRWRKRTQGILRPPPCECPMAKTLPVDDCDARALMLYTTYSAEVAALPSDLPGSVTQQMSYPFIEEE